MVALPPLLVGEMAILAALQSAVTCNGTELPSSAGTTSSSDSSSVKLPVRGPSRIQQPIAAMGDFHASTNGAMVDLEYTIATSSTALNWSQETGGLSFFYVDELPAATSLDSEHFLALPSFLTGVSLIFNQQLSPTVTINSSMQLVVDFSVLIGIGHPITAHHMRAWQVRLPTHQLLKCSCSSCRVLPACDVL